MGVQLADFSFGSKAWQEYYHGRNKDGHRPTPDRAQRVRASYKRAATKAGEREELDHRAAQAEAEAEAMARWMDDAERVAIEAMTDEETHEAPRLRAPKAQALTVQIRASVLPEPVIVALISAGWKWSHRRGGMWWARRSEDAERLAQAICAA